MTDLVCLDKDTRSGIATITLNRSEKRNALSSALIAELVGAFGEVLDVDDVACVVLTGADPAFCSGMDLQELGSGAENLALDFVSPLWETATPVIGAINGAAATGGLELALACDILVASERARFLDTHARVGVLPGAGMSVLLPAAVGTRKATEMSLTCGPLSADEAFRLGLVNRVVAHHDLLEVARALAHEIAANDRRIVKRINRLIKDNARRSLEDGIAAEREVFGRFIREELTPEAIEGRRADVLARGRAQA